jgi:hypothetical protein
MIKFISYKRMCALLGGIHRSTLSRWERNGTFIRSVELGAGRGNRVKRGFRADEYEAWVKRRQRSGQTPAVDLPMHQAMDQITSRLGWASGSPTVG